ncbi:N-acetylmuramoyl-L-alanine amidase [Marinicella litoralis]|uniref:N-acetylmuramoyl-L-alanine amidase n=1 Tax=Marinicella litoralis TaxID=644220 RepID=A0A4R6XGU6_9GAMM|nr:N-acetylmuramoyl-L-alanine amidase [Marinicella litoralis]TDR16313.1 N-acetylmuramoyl-L-alanine amidase [Marinicella litoralis]
MHIQKQPLPYESKLSGRELAQIELLVIHCTELPDLTMARHYGEVIHYSSGTGNSGHYYIDRDGSVQEWVKPNKIAHHVKGHNQQSIGIELVNSGRFPNWHDSNQQSPEETYPDALIDSLIKLINYLQAAIPSLKHIAGHEDLDQTKIAATDNPQLQIRRKIDPGPLFPWDLVMKNIRLINIGSNAQKYE